jgi:hypothetical protein
VCKFYAGAEDKALELKLKKMFHKVYRMKPESSRKVCISLVSFGEPVDTFRNPGSYLGLSITRHHNSEPPLTSPPGIERKLLCSIEVEARYYGGKVGGSTEGTDVCYLRHRYLAMVIGLWGLLGTTVRR